MCCVSRYRMIAAVYFVAHTTVIYAYSSTPTRPRNQEFQENVSDRHNQHQTSLETDSEYLSRERAKNSTGDTEEPHAEKTEEVEEGQLLNDSIEIGEQARRSIPSPTIVHSSDNKSDIAEVRLDSTDIFTVLVSNVYHISTSLLVSE